MTLAVKRVTTPEELDIAKAIRWRVFIEEQGFDGDTEVDEYDAKSSTYHFIGKDVEQDKYVAVARVLMVAPERTAKIGRVAVLPECRGKQYGVVLMAAVEEAVADEGIDLYALSAIYQRKEFYERCGYACISDEIYPEKGIDHCFMTKRAAKTG